MSEEVEIETNNNTTPGKILQWITIIGIGLGTLGPYVFPEKFASQVEEATIHADVKVLKEEVKEELRAEYDEKIKQAQESHGVMTTRIRDLEKQVASYESIIEGIQRHTEFNTHHISQNGEAVYQLMTLDKNAKGVRNTGNELDRWIYYREEWYKHPQLHPLRALSGGRNGYIYPFERDKILLEFDKR